MIEPLPSGEIHLGLWQAKGSAGRTSARRINELQVVVAQAIRCRRWFPRLTLWPELALRLTGARKPDAVLQDGTDDPAELRQLLDLDEALHDDIIPWTRRAPVIRGQIAVVQPGLSREAALAEPTGVDEVDVLQLLTVLEDTAIADGHDVVVLGSP